jgi:hypothetical protein
MDPFYNDEIALLFIRDCLAEIAKGDSLDK